ncbi:MAG: energy transducer TonB [Aquabacterium sp.]|nr:energy transducer TonB [Aquabacterium sp.]
MHAAPLHPPTSPAWAAHAPRRSTNLVVVGVAHAALVWLLLQGDMVQRAVQQASPLVVALLQDPAPAPAPQPALPMPPRPTLPPPATALLPLPALQMPDAPPAPAPATAPALVVPSPGPPSTTTAPMAPVAPAPTVAAPAPAPPAAAPPSPPVLAASTIRYRVAPAIAVPMASRRLGESGTVLLRVWVDAQGLPRQVSLHRSSGFARLDEQALAAMRQARFQPVTDGGSAIEWVVIAPLQYEID